MDEKILKQSIAMSPPLGRRNRFVPKHKLASYVDMSSATFSRFLRSHRAELSAMGMAPCAQKLSPRAVKYILHELGCE